MNYGFQWAGAHSTWVAEDVISEWSFSFWILNDTIVFINSLYTVCPIVKLNQGQCSCCWKTFNIFKWYICLVLWTSQEKRKCSTPRIFDFLFAFPSGQLVLGRLGHWFDQILPRSSSGRWIVQWGSIVCTVNNMFWLWTLKKKYYQQLNASVSCLRCCTWKKFRDDCVR